MKKALSKYNTDLDYVILDIDISREELKEIEAEADKIISDAIKDGLIKEKAKTDFDEYKNRKHKKTENSIRIDINNLFKDTLVDFCKEETLKDYFISEEDKQEAERYINWGLP